MRKLDEAEEQDLEKRMAAFMRPVKRTELEPDPFLETRLVARWRDHDRQGGRAGVWRWMALAASALSLVLMTRLFWPGGNYRDAEIDRKLVVKVSADGKWKTEPSFVEVVLPAGVEFDLPEGSELVNQRVLTLPWNAGGNGSLPFVVRGTLPGKRAIEVRYLDSDMQLIKEREVGFQFKAPVERSI